MYFSIVRKNFFQIQTFCQAVSYVIGYSAQTECYYEKNEKHYYEFSYKIIFFNL